MARPKKVDTPSGEAYKAAQRTGKCGAMNCDCEEWALGRRDNIWTVCAVCNHTQQVHELVV